ncbi:MAG: C10 family peptidase [Prevotella sp.]|nr:C10 family peptidase [Prevotella sp.]
MTKKFTLTLLALCAVVAAFANPITRSEARLVAQELLAIDDATADTDELAPYYIFSRGAGKGFVIVSGDDAVAPIIGYTDSGDFNEKDIPLQLADMLNAWKEKIEKLQKQPRAEQPRMSARARVAQSRRGVEGFKANWQDVPALCPTHWSQGSPYNDLCPVKNGQRAVTGCVATAASQIVYYFHKDNPDTLIYDTPTYTIDWGEDYGNYPVTTSLPAGTPVQYNLMRMSGHGTAAQDHAVAVLMVAVGTSSYLNYGPSTAGQPDEAGRALANQFWLDSDYEKKWENSQQGWETMIYASLKKGSPMLYGATHPQQGGHAVVLDGYQASTGLFHFNFGWGGGGDGWYTVDDETGMNGFKSDQRGCMNFHPRKQNLAAEVEEHLLYRGMENKVKVTVKNNGTLGYSGIYFYTNTKDQLPAMAKATDATLIPTGEKATIEFTCSPVSEGNFYVFVTDANKHIIATQTFTVGTPVAELTVDQMCVSDPVAVEELDEMNFARVNNSTVEVLARITNSQEATLCQPQLTGTVYVYAPDKKTWTRVRTVSHSGTYFEPGETRDIVMKVMGMEDGKYYKMEVGKQVRIGSVRTNPLTFDGDSIVYFTTRKPDFNVAINGRKAVATGKWNKLLFEESMGDSTVCVYDMTAVEDLVAQPVAPNPNALFLVANPIEGGTNIIANGVCDSLVIHTTSEFKPSEAFTARKAVLKLDRAEVGKWGNVLVPFAAQVPYGVQVNKVVDTQSVAATLEPVEDVIEAFTPVLYLIDYAQRAQFTAENVAVPADTVATVYDGLLTASTVAWQLTDVRYSTLGTDNNNNPVYRIGISGMPLEPFTVALMKSATNGIRAYSGPIDAFYRQLADSINNAYTLVAERSAYASEAQQTALLEAMKTAEDFFTYRQGEQVYEVKNAIAQLGEAMNEYGKNASGIENLPALAVEGKQETVEYYNLSGMRISRPAKGFVIVKRGNQVSKVMMR